MNKAELTLLWFDYNGYSFTAVEEILKNFDKIEDVFNQKPTKNAFFNTKLGAELKSKLTPYTAVEFKLKVLSDLDKYGLDFITFLSNDYPAKLKNIPSPPLVLYLRGNKSLLGKKSISIIGTRKPTTYGKIVCDKFTKELSSAGLVTVSGLAYGIDTCVAEATLACGGATIAVLAGGLDKIYPSENKSLSEKIVAEGGLLVSEQRPGVPPQNYMFVGRNRIVSALGLGTLIIEAGSASGTMTTARHAIEQGRELFVVPGNITSSKSEGTNALIDEMPDIFTISPKRILYKLGIKKTEGPKSQKQVDFVESQILDLLSVESMDFDGLSDKLALSPSELSAKLIRLEMFGLIKKGEGNSYYKC